MTTGFDYIFDNLFPTRRGAPPTFPVPVDGEVLAMLEEIAHDQQVSMEDLAAELFKKAVNERYQVSNQNVGYWESLSRRQQEVAALACLDYTNAEIAQKLDISLETVKTHMKEILRKFNVRGRHQLRYTLRKWDFSKFDEQATG